MTQISESRTRELLRWLDDQAGDHTHLFEQMARYRDAAALIRQLQAAEQSAWRAGIDEGRVLSRRCNLIENLLKMMDDERNITALPQAQEAR